MRQPAQVAVEEGAQIVHAIFQHREPIDPARSYTVAGWASVNEGTEGPEIWDVVESHIRKLGTVKLEHKPSVEVTGI